MSNQIDAISNFTSFFGKGDSYDSFNKNDVDNIKQYPKIMIDIVKLNGLCSYYNNNLWIINPLDYINLSEKILKSSIPIMKTSFGDLISIKDNGIYYFSFQQNTITFLIDNIDWFLGYIVSQPEFFENYDDTKYANELLGPLNYDESYNWVPALCMGGEKVRSNIKKVKTIEMIDIINHFQPLTPAS